MTQWINYLRRIAAAYRSGHYAIRPDLADAPAEFKLLGDAMSEMAEGIQDRDRRLREAVDMKTTLIQEIHHRVKNNLQIVMSLLSIQANQVKDLGARDALMQAQTRINALALVHRILNELEDQSTLDLRQLLEELSRQIAEGMGKTRCAGSKWMCPSRVVAGSVAVALALFTVEALTNIFKHAFPRDRRGRDPGQHGVRMAGGKLKLAIADNGMGFAMDETGKSVGSPADPDLRRCSLGACPASIPSRARARWWTLVFPDPDLKDEARAPSAAANVASSVDAFLESWFSRQRLIAYGPARKSGRCRRHGRQFRRDRDRRRPRRLQCRHPAGPAGPHRRLRRQARQPSAAPA